jgi:hypothetical protein
VLAKLILLSASLLLAIPASAGLILFAVVPSGVQAPPGGNSNPACQNGTLDCAIFSGTISFTDDQDYFVDDIAISMSPANPDGGALVAGNDNYFQATVPGLFGPDAGFTSYMGGLFEIDVPSNAPPGIYNGTATLVAFDSIGDPIVGLNVVQSFQVDVIPEPGMFTLMFAGLASLAAVACRRKSTA